MYYDNVIFFLTCNPERGETWKRMIKKGVFYITK